MFAAFRIGGNFSIHFCTNNISFSLMPQDYLSIVGPSGVGKSTLLHVIGGLEPPTKGKVIFNRADVYQMGDRRLALWRNKNIGFIFQAYHLIEELNVVENVSIASWAGGLKSSFKRVKELLEYLDIDKRKSFFPSQLSGGEKQKVAIARALVNEPDIILCDEPTGNLDKDSLQKVMELLNKLNVERKKTIVLVTHNWELAKRAKRTLCIKGGVLTCAG